jgi:hypothetical protein
MMERAAERQEPIVVERVHISRAAGSA